MLHIKTSRLFAMLLCLAMLFVALVPAALAEESIVIRVFTRYSGSDSMAARQQEMIAEFEAAHPGVTIQDESINDGTGYANKLATDIASGNIPDVMCVPGIASMLEYAINGVYMDVTDIIMNDEDLKANLDASVVDLVNLAPYGVDGIYALPTANQMEVFYYNKALFEQAGIESIPQTWDEFDDACEKLKAIGVIPWAVGAKNPWRVVHIHTGLLYKMCGVDKAAELGARTAKWTDPDVVATIDFIVQMKQKGYFPNSFEGIDYETEKQMFLNGEAAMRFDGSWAIGEFPEDMADNIGTFRMPYFADKPEFKGDDIGYPSQLEISGKLEDGEKKELVVEFVKMFVNKTSQETVLYDVKNIPVRSDIEADTERAGALVASLLNYKENDITRFGSDSWAYDPLPIMEQVVSDALIGALLDLDAQTAAQQIQNRIERAS